MESLNCAVFQLATRWRVQNRAKIRLVTSLNAVFISMTMKVCDVIKNNKITLISLNK